MALPLVKVLGDCVDYGKTVSAFVPQLQELPQQMLNSFSGSQSFVDVYTSTNPLISAFAFSLFLAPIFLVVSEVNGNYSQVDRVWSMLPTFYTLHYATFARLIGQPTARTDLALAATMFWTVRLTSNYYRRGGYERGSEDYRWQVVKDFMGQPWFFLFNVVFISLVQSVLLFVLTTPGYVLLLSSQVERTLSSTDIAFGLGMVGLASFTGLADLQQWNFHQAKENYQKSAKVPSGWNQNDLDRGFNTVGLFRYSRHPNFAAEQGVWICFFQWSCSVTQSSISQNWTVVAPLLYLALFQASTWLTELLSSRKYPEYKEYQKQVGMFVPIPFLRGGFAKKQKAAAKKRQ